MKKIYLLIIVLLMFLLVGCQTQSSGKKVGVNIDKITLSNEKEELILNIGIIHPESITEKNYIKQFNYYYSFEETTKEDLVKQQKNVINNKELVHYISFTETNYKKNISIIFEIETAKHKKQYSEVVTINIFDFAKETYEQDQTNLIARQICYPGEVLLNFEKISLSNETEEIIYEISLYNESFITESNYIKQFNYYYAFDELTKEELLKQEKNTISNKELSHKVTFNDSHYKSDLSIIFEIELALDGLIYSNVKTINIYKLAQDEYSKDKTNSIAKKICDEGQVLLSFNEIKLSTEKEEVLFNSKIDFSQWITEENYIKQYNFYYSFSDSSKEELLSLEKNSVSEENVYNIITLSEANYKNKLSIIFEIELAQDGFIYSNVKTINIFEFAKSEYYKNEANKIARKICGLGEVKINYNNLTLSDEKEELIYQISILNDILITEKNYIKQFNYYYSFEETSFDELIKTTKYQINNNELVHNIEFTDLQYKSDISIVFEIELALDGFIYSNVKTINILELAQEEYLKNQNNLIAEKICNEGSVIINCTNISLSDEKEELYYEVKLGFDHWITDDNYIKQFNYYYGFGKLSKKELLKQNKNPFNIDDLTHSILFDENNYNDDLSIIYEMELSSDGFIYSTISIINIADFALEAYHKNEANMIARKICGFGDIELDISNVKLSSTKEEIIYELSLLNDILITETNYIKQIIYYYSFVNTSKESLLLEKKNYIRNNDLTTKVAFKEENYTNNLSIMFEIELALDGIIYSNVKTINITDFAKEEYKKNEANKIARKICGLKDLEIKIDNVSLSSSKEEFIYNISILNDNIVTEKNYIKQFNYYYMFKDATLDELLMQSKVNVLNKGYIYNVAFSRAYYENNLSIVFEIELALDGYIYSNIKSINITEFARDVYLKDETNLIAKNICEYNTDKVVLIELTLDLNKKQLSGETATYSYTYSNPSYNKITVIVTLKEGFTFSEYFVFKLNDEVLKSSKYTIEDNVITYIFDDPNWSIIV